MGTDGTAVLIIVKGKPVPKQRPRFRGNYAYTPAKTRAQEQLIKETYMTKCGRMLEGPLEADYEFIYEPPKSWSKKRRAEAMGKPMLTVPDTDNLIKLVQDALNAAAYTDDNQIYRITSRKVYGPEAMTIIRLREA